MYLVKIEQIRTWVGRETLGALNGEEWDRKQGQGSGLQVSPEALLDRE
ncbi:MAG: hypothetical protein ABFS37_05865 [Acidobacteriota bacterium]